MTVTINRLRMRLQRLRPDCAVMRPGHEEGAFCLGLRPRCMPFAGLFRGRVREELTLHVFKKCSIGPIERGQLRQHLDLREAGLTHSSIEARVGATPRRDAPSRHFYFGFQRR